MQQGPPRSAVGIRCESELSRTLRCHRPHTLPLLRSLGMDHIIYSRLKGLLQVLVIVCCPGTAESLLLALGVSQTPAVVDALEHMRLPGVVWVL